MVLKVIEIIALLVATLICDACIADLHLYWMITGFLQCIVIITFFESTMYVLHGKLVECPWGMIVGLIFGTVFLHYVFHLI